MGASCFYCVRYVVVLFNFLFVLIGVALLSVSLYFYFAVLKDYQDSQQYETVTLAMYATTCVAGLTILVGAFGCCGAYHESECLLGAYFVCLILIFGVEVSAGVLGFVFKSELKNAADKFMKEKFVSYEKDKIVARAIDTMQMHLECCGYEGAHTYGINKLPPSCCAAATAKEMFTCTKERAFPEGCQDKVPKFVDGKLVLIFISVLSCAAIEFFGLLISMMLCCQIRSAHEHYEGVDQDFHHA